MRMFRTASVIILLAFLSVTINPAMARASAGQVVTTEIFDLRDFFPVLRSIDWFEIDHGDGFSGDWTDQGSIVVLGGYGKPGLYTVRYREWDERSRPKGDWVTLGTILVTVDTPPKAWVRTPLISTHASKGASFRVSYGASDDYEMANVSLFCWNSENGQYERIHTSRDGDSFIFKGEVGQTYYFTASALDNRNHSAYSEEKKTIVPYDQNSLIVQRVGFENMVKNYKSDLYLGTARYSTTASDFLRIKFTGDSVRLIGPKGPGLSKAKIYIDGNYYKTIDPYKSTLSQRQVLFIKTFASRGTHTIKVVNVDNRSRFTLDGVAAGLAPPDRSAPSTILTAPPLSTKQSKTPNFKVFWTVKDRFPSSGIASFDVKYRESGTSTWKMWKKGTTGRSAVFKGTIGKTYYFKARAKDHAGNTGRWSSGKRTIVPYDQNSLINSKSGFAKTYSKTSSKLYLGTMRYSTAPKTYVKYRFWGNKVFLVGPKTPGTSRYRIFVDGKYQGTFDGYSSRVKHRQVLFGKAFSGSGTHTIKIVNVGDRNRLSLDAIAVQR